MMDDALQVTFQPWQGSHGPVGPAVDLGTHDGPAVADHVVAEHLGRVPWGGPVSDHAAFGKARETAAYALHVCNRGTYRFVEVG